MAGTVTALAISLIRPPHAALDRMRHYQGAGKLRGESLCGGKVFEKPSNVIALAVTTAWDVMICYCPLAVKVMHVFEATA